MQQSPIQYSPQPLSAQEFAYTATRAGVQLAQATFCLVHTRLHLKVYNGDASLEVCEILLRAAFLYAAARGAYTVYAPFTIACNTILHKMGFVPQNEWLYAEIPEVLTGNCEKTDS